MFSIGLSKQKIIIFTDSLSSLQSIENCLKLANTNKYLETKILNAINYSNMETVLYWIPGHIGNKDHDIADNAAKDSKNTIAIDKIPIDEIIRNVKQLNRIEWLNTYDQMTQTKGLFYKHIINSNLRYKPWFKNINLKSSTIKLINRLRSGHSFDKKTLHIMKIEDSNLCPDCNVIENAEHIITQCTKFNNIRNKYKYLVNADYGNILRNEKTYIEIENYLNEIKYYF